MTIGPQPAKARFADNDAVLWTAGSVVGHGISNMLFGGGSRAEAPPPAEIQAAPVNQAQYSQQGAACSVEAKGAWWLTHKHRGAAKADIPRPNPLRSVRLSRSPCRLYQVHGRHERLPFVLVLPGWVEEAGSLVDVRARC